MLPRFEKVDPTESPRSLKSFGDAETATGSFFRLLPMFVENLNIDVSGHELSEGVARSVRPRIVRLAFHSRLEKKMLTKLH